MSALINLALLETLKAHDFKDEIDLYIPFIAVTISEINEIPFGAKDLATKLKELFEFKPPEAVIKVLLNRAKKRKLVKVKNHQYIPNTPKLEPYVVDYNNKKDIVEKSLSKLISGLVIYSKDKFNKEISTEDAQESLLNFVAKNLMSLLQTRKFDKDYAGVKNIQHLIAKYITYIYRNNPELWSSIEVLARGMTLANYLFFADKNQSNQKKTDFSNATVYFDTPILISLLGFSGPSSQEAVRDLMAMLKSMKVNIFVYIKSVEELEGLISAWKRDIQSGNYDNFNPKTLELLRRNKYDVAKLETELSLLEDTLTNQGIEIDKNYQNDPKYQCDEAELEKLIKRKVTGSEPNKKKRLEHDVLCISHVHNSRKGQCVSGMSDTFSVFVTPNSGLVKHVNSFFSKEVGRGIPIVVSDAWLTTIFWLKNNENFKSLPSSLLISNAYATLNKTDLIWDNFIERLESLKDRGEITNEQYEKVRFDKRLLMDVHDISIDIGEEFTDMSVYEIIDRVEARLEENKDRAVQEVQQEMDSKLGERDKKIEEAETTIEGARSKLQSISKWCSNILTALIFIALIYGSVKGIELTNISTVVFNDVSSFIYIFCVGIYLLVQWIGQVSGWSLLNLRDWLQQLILSKLESLLLNTNKQRVDPLLQDE